MGSCCYRKIFNDVNRSYGYLPEVDCFPITAQPEVFYTSYIIVIFQQFYLFIKEHVIFVHLMLWNIHETKFIHVTFFPCCSSSLLKLIRQRCYRETRKQSGVRLQCQRFVTAPFSTMGKSSDQRSLHLPVSL